MTLSPQVFDVLSALALRLGVRVSARELQAQSAQLGDGPLSLMSAAQALGRHGLEARIGQLAPAHYDTRMGPVVVGLESEGAALLLGRQEQACQVLLPGASPAAEVQRSTDALQTDWSGWSLQARLSTVRDSVHATADAQGDKPMQGAHWFWGVFRT